ncbi:MAG: hypothetical protein ACRDD1_07405, partial [Planctomycetia bacterium]
GGAAPAPALVAAAPVAPMVTAAPVGVAPAPPTAQYVAPQPAPQQYVAPQPAPAPQQQGQTVERTYQQSEQGGTTLIERTYENGKVVEEKKRYYAPGERLPPPRDDVRGSSYTPTAPADATVNPRLLRPIPTTRTTSTGGDKAPVRLAASPYYR